MAIKSLLELEFLVQNLHQYNHIGANSEETSYVNVVDYTVLTFSKRGHASVRLGDNTLLTFRNNDSVLIDQFARARLRQQQSEMM